MKYAALIALLAASPVNAQDAFRNFLEDAEIRMQSVACSPYEKVAEFMVLMGQQRLFQARGSILDSNLTENGLEMQGIPGVYEVWTDQDSGIATMVFVDANGHSCIQATMTQFSPYTGE